MRKTPSSDPFAVVIAAGWLALYTWRSTVGHYSLGTNAFDLSVFDYALWNLVHHGTGYVPFMGHSIFSHHFMPILVVLAPVYAVFQSPVFLLVFQLVATAAAALALFAIARRSGAPRIPALVLLSVFLLSRRTHSALAGYFYPESLQALLTFLLVLAWPRGGWKYWTVLLLFLMTKEDAAIYAGAFAVAAFMLPDPNRRRSGLTLVVACLWFGAALFLAIPASRAADGLSLANPLLESRFGSPSGEVQASLLLGRVLSATTAGTVANLLLMAAALPLAAPLWLLPALPGLLVNVAAEPGSMQAALSDHYVWPILPWLFIASAAGIVRIGSRSARVALVWTLVWMAATCVDNPALRRILSTRPDAQAAEVRAHLPVIDAASVVLAQPNVIPHLPHVPHLYATGGGARAPHQPDVVLLTTLGNTWPHTHDEVLALITQYERDAAYDRVGQGPLAVFVRRGVSP
jgi:uncharacterized membrane protein